MKTRVPPRNEVGSQSRFATTATAVCLTAAFTGCMIGPDYSPPNAELTPAWREADVESFRGAPTDQVEWWKIFQDPVLETLIQEAWAKNPSLQAASMRVVEARVGLSARNLFLFPLLSGSGSIAHVNNSQNVRPDVDVSLPKVSVNLPQNGANLPQLVDVSGKASVQIADSLDVYSLGGGAAWELDVWGQFRRGIEASEASLAASYASYDDVMVSLTGDVASSYVQIRTLSLRIATMQKNVEEMKKFQAICDAKFAKKESPETDVVLARTLVALVELGLPQLEQSKRQAENSLCMLLGRMPSDLGGELGVSDHVPVVMGTITVGIPADLLRRRPDVTMAEQLAHAQCARIGMAKAAILPSFSLLGSIGLQSSHSSDLFDHDSVMGGYGGSVGLTNLLNYPLFVQRVRLEDARFEQSLLQYELTVQNAAREVEDAMFGFLQANRSIAIAKDGAQAAARATQLAVGAYDAGKVIVSVPLVALTFMANLEDAAIAAKGAAAIQAVTMYKALGGGWQALEGHDIVPAAIRDRMKERSDWSTFGGDSNLSTEDPKP